MECRARDFYDFFNVKWQTVDVIKAHKIVMKSDIVYKTTYKNEYQKRSHFISRKKNLDVKNCLTFVS